MMSWSVYGASIRSAHITRDLLLARLSKQEPKTTLLMVKLHAGRMKGIDSAAQKPAVDTERDRDRLNSIISPEFGPQTGFSKDVPAAQSEKQKDNTSFLFPRLEFDLGFH